MWTLHATVETGDNRALVHARDEEGVVRVSAFLVADILQWLSEHGQEAVMYHSETGRHTFNFGGPSDRSTPQKLPPPGRTVLLGGMGIGKGLKLAIAPDAPHGRPQEYYRSQAFTERGRLSKRWRHAGQPPRRQQPPVGRARGGSMHRPPANENPVKPAAWPSRPSEL